MEHVEWGDYLVRNNDCLDCLKLYRLWSNEIEKGERLKENYQRCNDDYRELCREKDYIFQRGETRLKAWEKAEVEIKRLNEAHAKVIRHVEAAFDPMIAKIDKAIEAGGT